MTKTSEVDNFYSALKELEPWALDELKCIEKQLADQANAEALREAELSNLKGSGCQENHGLIGFLCGLFCGLAISGLIFLIWVPSLN